MSSFPSSSQTVEVVPYNPAWPAWFEEEAHHISHALQACKIAIHHVGSTAVPQLAAKPKIDMIAVVTDLEAAKAVLESIGYTFEGEWNIPFKYGFTKRGERDFNLHVFEENHPEIELNLVFRDYLRSHPLARDTYAKLKENLAQSSEAALKPKGFFKGYTLGKDSFIRETLQKTGFNRLRFLRCAHGYEHAAVQQMQALESGPLCLTLSSRRSGLEECFVLYQGVEIKGCGFAKSLGNGVVEVKIHTFPHLPPLYAETLETLVKKWLSFI